MKKDILIIVCLFSIALLIRVVNVSHVCLYPDEWSYWINVNRILANNWVPTAEAVKYTPPFLAYIGAVVTVIFGGELNTLRMISVILGSLTVPFLYLFGKMIYDRKTGLLAALFLCFSAFHCLWSRVFMLEALTLFFITAFLYFFWLSQRSEGRKSTTYAIIAGAVLGLAIDAKYLPFFLVPAVLLYVLWTERFSFKALLDKRIILIFIFAFLFFLPLLTCLYYVGVGLDPIYFHAVERFEVETATGRTSSVPLTELVGTYMEKEAEVLTWGNQVLISPWKDIFFVSALPLLLISLFSYLPSLLKKEKESSFLLISVLMLLILLFNCAAYKHYLIYLFPFFLVIISHIAVKSFEHLRKGNSYKKILRVFIISLTVIMLFSSFIVGVTSPYWDEGEYSWAKKAVEHIKSDVTKSGYDEPVLIGWITLWKIIDYSTDLSAFNAPDTLILKRTPGEYYVDLEKIDLVKPGYLIVGEDHYNAFFDENVKREIFEDYKIISSPHTYPQKCYIFKRKSQQPLELREVSPRDGKNGELSQDVFKRSVPDVMKIGEVYTALVQVKNTGDSRTTFTGRVYSDEYTVFVEAISAEDMHELILDKGSSRILKFKIVPLKEYVGELPITVDLYIKYEEDGTYGKKVDSVSDSVYLIKK